MQGYSLALESLKETAARHGALSFYDMLLNANLLTNKEKLKIAVLWKIYTGEGDEEILAEWNKQTARAAGLLDGGGV